MKQLAPSKGLNLESLRGSYCYDLTLGITRDAPASAVWAPPI